MTAMSTLLSRPSVPILLRSVGWAAWVWTVLAALAWAVAGAEDTDLSLLGLVGTLGPLAWAVGVASAIAGAVQRGEWTGWTALGHSSRRWSAGVLALGILFGLASLGGGVGRVPLDGLALPAPVAEDARRWPTPEGWTAARFDRWTVPPHELTLVELVARSTAAAPLGSRRGVDVAELVRRGVFALAWPLAVLFGIRFGGRVSLRGGRAGPAAAWSAGAVGLWLLAGALVSAYSSTIT